jgi:hypothetical protein
MEQNPSSAEFEFHSSDLAIWRFYFCCYAESNDSSTNKKATEHKSENTVNVWNEGLIRNILSALLFSKYVKIKTQKPKFPSVLRRNETRSVTTDFRRFRTKSWGEYGM